MPPEQLRIVHMDGSGCYGHNGADDAAADAALIARAVPGRPVRVQWMREQEHAWEPYGPAMVTKVRGSLGADGRIVDWDYSLWSNAHSTRPGPRRRAARRPGIWRKPFPGTGAEADPAAFRQAAVATRFRCINSPMCGWSEHFLPEMPLRVSALRALGGYMNVFAIESFMDELAEAADADPVEFRLRHLEDPRARDVVTAAAERFGWPAKGKAADGHGYGFGFARYKNFASYCAVAVEVEVDPETGRARLVRAARAVEAGQVVNPDGLTNQIEGGDPAVDELDALRKGGLRRHAHHHHRLGDLSDLALRQRCPKRSTSRSSTGPICRSSAAARRHKDPTAAAIGNAVSRAIRRAAARPPAHP